MLVVSGEPHKTQSDYKNVEWVIICHDFIRFVMSMLFCIVLDCLCNAGKRCNEKYV